MKLLLLTFQIVAFTVHGVAAPVLQQKALVISPYQAPIGQLPYTGGAVSPYQMPYATAQAGVSMQANTGSYAYTPNGVSTQLMASPYVVGWNGQVMPNPQMSPYAYQQFQQAGYQYPQAGYSPYGSSPYGYPQNGYPQNGYQVPMGYGQQGFPQAGFAGGASAQGGMPVLSPALLSAAIATLPGILGRMFSGNDSNPSHDSLHTSGSDYRPGDYKTDHYKPSDSYEPSARRSSLDDSKFARRDSAAPPVNREQEEIIPEPSVPPIPRGQVARNDAEGLIRSAERINRAVGRTNPNTARPPRPDCPECREQQARDEQCTSTNNYLESALANASNSGLQLLKQNPPSRGTVKCISESLRSMNTERMQFVNCPKAGVAYGEIVTRPCASDKMVTTVASAYELVSECLAGFIDPRADQAGGQTVRASLKRSAFQIFNYESGWAVNSADRRAKPEGGGLAHLVAPVIDGINTSQFDKMKEFVNKSGNKSCQILAKYKMQPMKANRENSCDRVSLDNGNPILSLMYSMALMKVNRAGFYKTATTVAGISVATRERIIDQLMIWSHGAGGDLVNIAFQNALKKNAKLLSGQSSEEKIQQFLTTMKAEVKATQQAYIDAAPQEKRAKLAAIIDPERDANYLESTRTELATVETRLNSPNSCGRF